jgi:hypothetical protein
MNAIKDGNSSTRLESTSSKQAFSQIWNKLTASSWNFKGSQSRAPIPRSDVRNNYVSNLNKFQEK